MVFSANADLRREKMAAPVLRPHERRRKICHRARRQNHVGSLAGVDLADTPGFGCRISQMSRFVLPLVSLRKVTTFRHAKPEVALRLCIYQYHALMDQ